METPVPVRFYNIPCRVTSSLLFNPLANIFYLHIHHVDLTLELLKLSCVSKPVFVLVRLYSHCKYKGVLKIVCRFYLANVVLRIILER